MNEADLEELEEQFEEEGLFGEINPSIINYIDYKTISRDLACDYA
jgi:antirestriction protein